MMKFTATAVMEWNPWKGTCALCGRHVKRHSSEGSCPMALDFAECPITWFGAVTRTPGYPLTGLTFTGS